MSMRHCLDMMYIYRIFPYGLCIGSLSAQGVYFASHSGAPLYFETFPVPSSSAHIYRLKVVPNKVGVWPPFGLGADLIGSNLYPRVQRKLLPHHKNLLLLPPPTRIDLLKVELPKEVGQYESHFQVCEIAAEAVSRPNRERVEGGSWRA